MPQNRIESHPILKISPYKTIEFFWKDKLFQAKAGETIASALIANGVDIFGHHPKDGKPLGLFCANGQCSQCLVLVEGKPIKACMTKVKQGMSVYPADGLPDVADIKNGQIDNPPNDDQEVYEIPVLVIGGGPAGLSAAIELGQLGIKVLLVDDKSELGGKLVLQTHRFFGSTQAVYAGTRGIDIAQKLADKLTELDNVEIWLETTAVGIFEERTVGLWRVEDEKYILVKPEILLVATGARERNLTFKGNTLPGIIGAGAFQTLVNRDLIKPARDLFIVGGGNVGLIAGYHALQAGINVVGLVEALPECGGYKVHEDKLARLGVPIYTSHTILEAKGQDRVQSVKIAEVDANFQPILGTEKEFSCDCVLIAVGLNPVDEFITKANEVGLTCFSAGDAGEIAEASAAMFSGKIKGLEIARKLNRFSDEIPQEWRNFENILKSKPGEITHTEFELSQEAVFPVIHCRQEIPCDPCAYICPLHLIKLQGDDILGLPEFSSTADKHCIGCERCVAVCPGLAITLVDAREDPSFPTVSLPYEFLHEDLNIGDLIKVTDENGNLLGRYPIMGFNNLRKYSRTTILRVQVPRNIATLVAGVQLDTGWSELEQASMIENHPTDQEAVVCRCEHISADVIRALIRDGVTDINQIKAETKATMGACGGKTCLSLLKKIFKEEGVLPDEVTDPTQRPLFVEVPLEILAKNDQQMEQS